MKDIESIIRLNCNEEFDIRYFAKDGSITDTTLDYSELLEYINEIEDKNARLHSIIKEVREYIEYQLENLDFEEDTKAKMLGAMVLVLLDKEKKKWEELI